MNAVTAAVRTRDGMVSVAAMLEAGSLDALGSVDVAVEDALAWAAANKVDLTGEGRKIDRVNALRAEYGLPLFRLVKRVVPVGEGVGETPTLAAPRQARVAGQPAPIRQASVLAHPAACPVAIPTQDALLELALHHTGTITTLVDQDLAGWLLAINHGNRPMQRAGVVRHVNLLKAGTFLNTGEPVIVSRDGTLNDGQHRLQAIFETGIPAELDIRFGIDRAAFAATGTGMKRTAGNVLAIAGKPHASAQAAIARLIWHYDRQNMASCHQVVEPGAVLETAEREAQVGAVAARQSGYKFTPARLAPLGLVLAIAARSVPHERVFAFADLVASGVAEETDPARLLHVRLRDAAIAKARLHQVEVAALCCRAWNAWAEGRTMTRLVVSAEDRTSAGFPTVTAATEASP